MKIEVREIPFKTVLFWISREEASDIARMSSLKTRFKELKAQGYLPVIMESGTGNPEDSVYLLMKHNYEMLAEKEIAANGIVDE